MKKFIFNLLFILLTNTLYAFADIDQQSGGEPLMDVQLSNSTLDKIEISSFHEYVAGFRNQLMAFTTEIEGQYIHLYLYNQSTKETKEFLLDLDLISPDLLNIIDTGKKSLKSKKWEKIYWPK